MKTFWNKNFQNYNLSKYRPAPKHFNPCEIYLLKYILFKGIPSYQTIENTE